MKISLLYVLLAFCLLFGACAISAQKHVEFTPKSPSPEIFAKIKKDIVDKAIETGNRLGYAVMDYDYEKGSVNMNRKFISSNWTVNITTVVQNGVATANIYAPSETVGSGPDLDTFHQALMKLY